MQRLFFSENEILVPRLQLSAALSQKQSSPCFRKRALRYITIVSIQNRHTPAEPNVHSSASPYRTDSALITIQIRHHHLSHPRTQMSPLKKMTSSNEQSRSARSCLGTKAKRRKAPSKNLRDSKSLSRKAGVLLFFRLITVETARLLAHLLYSYPSGLLCGTE